MIFRRNIKQLIVLLFLMGMGSTLSFAQDDLSDPKAIFAHPETVQFGIIADDKTRSIHFYQAGWHIIPYPTDATERCNIQI